MSNIISNNRVTINLKKNDLAVTSLPHEIIFAGETIYHVDTLLKQSPMSSFSPPVFQELQKHVTKSTLFSTFIKVKQNFVQIA